MSVTHSFTQTSTGAIINIKVNANCKTRHLVYLMTCKQCQKLYVGETRLQLNQRINLHRSDVNTRKLERSPIAEHIHTTGHTFSDILLWCIDHNPNWSDQTRKLHEVSWIRRLNTTRPNIYCVFPVICWCHFSVTFCFVLMKLLTLYQVSWCWIFGRHTHTHAHTYILAKLYIVFVKA